MTPLDRTIVARWAWPDFDEGHADELLELFGSPYAVALQLLQEHLGRLTKLAADTAAGGRRSNHEKNIDAARSQRDHLVSMVAASSDISLGSAAETLFAEAVENPGTATVPISISSPNRRRAG